jgi:hypothetical protein
MRAIAGSVRKLVLGETWTVPTGVGLLLGLGTACHRLAPDAWSRFGGAILVLGAFVILLACTQADRDRSEP